MAKPRAVFLTPERPALGQGGGGLRSASLLEYLRGKYDVDVVAIEVEAHSRSTAARLGRNTLRLIRGRPPLFDRYSGYEEQIARKLNGPYELAVIEHFWCASYAPLLRSCASRLVLDLHNIESQLARTHSANLNGLEEAAWVRFANSYQELEAHWLPQFDTLLVVSDEDRERVRHPDVRVFPNALPEYGVTSSTERNAIVIFSGNLEYHPNVEAVRWFAAEIWPLVRAQHPDLEWRLVGCNPQAVEPMLQRIPNVRLTGPVEDALPEIAASQVAVVPLRSGSGTRFKILEAWAAQRPVVSTSIGAEGLGARDGEHLLIADDADAFALAVTQLLLDAPLRARLGAAGRELYLEKFTWPAAWRRLDEQGGV